MKTVGKPQRAVNGYTAETLENNWVEDRFDIKYLRDSKPLQSQYNHYYQSSYKLATSNVEKLNFPSQNAVNASTLRNPGFPGHQPEMDGDSLKERLNTYETDHRVNYIDPRLRQFPFDLKKMLIDEVNQQEKQNVSQAPLVTFESTQVRFKE